ncbi:BCCT family transporter [Anaerotignum sp.]|uniref:BCCT family transporter n=1 Tax=Anaerotignum sp. TaxID=2039241 RepID=UPI002714B97F|nr:BCCT family transporter [Anaerotignum sp.]
MKKRKYVKGSIHKEVLGVVGTLLIIEIVLGVFFTDAFGAVMSKMIYFVGDNFGWWIDMCAVMAVVLGICYVIFRYGDIRIGGEDAKPEYSTWQWFSISICGGIGCGLLFWAMGEPIYHFVNPPAAIGIQSQSREAAIFAVGQTMFDWSFVQYFIYTIPAVVFALLAYNCKRPLSFRALVTEITGKDRIWLTTLLHICCGYAVASGVSNSMAAGLLQISGGLNAIFGIPQNKQIYLFITVFVGTFFILSCLTGINKGLTYVSWACMLCFLGLMLYVIIVGDAQFIGKLGMESFGNIMDNFFGKITYNNALIEHDQWANEWPITFWNSFFIYAPVMGMFLARMGKGRTVREFMLVEILVPSLFCCLFIAVFSSTIIQMQVSGAVDVWANVQELGMQTALYQVLGEMHGGRIVQFVFLIAVCLSFVTLADPNTSAMATLCVHEQPIDDEPPKMVKIIIGIVVSIVAYLLVISGGVNAVKGLLNIGGLLMTIPTVWLFVSLPKIGGKLLKCKKQLLDEEMEKHLEGDVFL